MKRSVLKLLAWVIGSFVVLFFYFWWLGEIGKDDPINDKDPDESGKIQLTTGWKFNDEVSHGEDRFLNDSLWITVVTDSLPSEYNGEPAWFRLHLPKGRLDKSEIYAIEMNHYGASEIYLNGKKVADYGRVAENPEEEIIMQPASIPVQICPDANEENILAVHYSNLRWKEFTSDFNSYRPGFNLGLITSDAAIGKQSVIRSSIVASTSIGIFLATLALIHFLLYLFYRRASENLFFSLFSLSYAVIFFLTGLSAHTTDPDIIRSANKLLMLMANPILFFTLLLFVYRVYEKSFPKIGWLAVISSILSACYILFGWFGMGVFSMSGVWLAVFTVFTMLIETVRAIREKRPGARIMGVSIILFALFIFFLLSLLFYSAGRGLHISLNEPAFLVVLLLLMLCIPISMSVYLAYKFSVTSRHLEKQLREVESLSTRTIEQEKEKQKILSEQKEILEVQVKERTAEIVEQKKVIEEKNKDITDSIHYAKKIQDAMLPTGEFVSQLFPNAFILFRPKDIVSGDFYWVAEQGGYKYIAAVDCTGHGVPGALMSMTGNNFLNQLVLERNVASPSEILAGLDDAVRKSLRQDRAETESKDGMDIALCRFNADLTRLNYSGANRPLWVVRNKQLMEYKATKQSIGGSEINSTFTEHELELQSGDCIYIFSDGYADQFGGPEGKKFMTKNMKELLVGVTDQSPAEQKRTIEEAITGWMGSLTQVDDILVIGIQV